MREDLRKTVSIGSGLIVILVIGWVVFEILVKVWHGFESLSGSVQIAISVAILSLVSTLGSLVYTKIKDRKLQFEARNISKKQKLYDRYVQQIIGLIANPDKANDDNYTQELRLNFMSKAILWADWRVLDAYHNLRINTQVDKSLERTLWDFSTLFLEFRKDLGLSNKKINQTTIAEIMYDKNFLDEFYKKYPQQKGEQSKKKTK